MGNKDFVNLDADHAGALFVKVHRELRKSLKRSFQTGTVRAVDEMNWQLSIKLATGKQLTRSEVDYIENLSEEEEEDKIMEVKYVGVSTKNFTRGKIYSVISIDADGDYILLDNYNDQFNHYKRFFEPVKKENK